MVSSGNGVHSTKCIGVRSVDGFKVRPDCLLIPIRRKIRDKTKRMQYNEFIVYNEAQVQMKYLAEVKLEYNQPAWFWASTWTQQSKK